MTRSRSRRFLGIPDEFWVGFVVMVGFFLKLVYDIELGYTRGTVSAGVWKAMKDGVPNSGQIGVIQYYFTTHHLPDFDPRSVSCFSNPPFYYIVSALYLEIIHRLLRWDIGIALHVVQCINVVYVLIGTGACIGILGKFGIRGRKMVISILFLTFFPTFYLLSGALEPAAMSYMFMMLSLQSSLSWYNSRRAGSLTRTAVQIGLGLMTSPGCLTVLLPVLFLMRHAVTDGRRSSVPFSRQFRKFALITAALGLWWPLYRLIRFGVPLLYWETASGEPIRQSLISRLRIPSPAMLAHLHTVSGGKTESNIWAQIFKTALVGFDSLDISLRGTYIVTMLALYLSILICLIFHVMLIYTLFTERLDTVRKRFILIGYLSILVSFILAAGWFPNTGTVDFRYMAPILVFPLIGFGLCGGADGTDNLFEKITHAAVSPMVLIFSLISAFLFGFYL
ncbi:hypothetical protein [Chordicoccus furentiruminis]|uniref:hypothetical protein n=1 Tax=Chordicoccus furentiruminis TaxID=2709410 RepID=UPI0023A8DFE5|nr:hypothetical protein [Chordicoccus furentiruminis]